MPVLDRPDGSIHYQASGTGSPGLLLTHGFAATSAMVAPNLAALALRNLVLPWALRWHGRTESPPDQARYIAATALAAILPMLSAAGLDRAVQRRRTLC